MSETLHFEYLGCEWAVDVYIEPDTATTPGSISIENVRGWAHAGKPLPDELVEVVEECVIERALEEAARG